MLRYVAGVERVLRGGELGYEHRAVYENITVCVYLFFFSFFKLFCYFLRHNDFVYMKKVDICDHLFVSYPNPYPKPLP